MGQDPSTIRKDIEQTRERMGDTVDALAYKTDVGARTRDAVTGRVDAVKEKLGVAGDHVSGAADALPSTGDVKAQGRKAKGLAQENPLGLAVGAVAVGFVAGLLIPNTKVENDTMAPMAGELRERAEDAVHVAAEHGKEAAQDVAGAVQQAAGDVADAATSAGREHAEQAKEQVTS
jgi:gas vesicle protein